MSEQSDSCSDSDETDSDESETSRLELTTSELYPVTVKSAGKIEISVAKLFGKKRRSSGAFRRSRRNKYRQKATCTRHPMVYLLIWKTRTFHSVLSITRIHVVPAAATRRTVITLTIVTVAAVAATITTHQLPLEAVTISITIITTMWLLLPLLQPANMSQVSGTGFTIPWVPTAGCHILFPIALCLCTTCLINFIVPYPNPSWCLATRRA